MTPTAYSYRTVAFASNRMNRLYLSANASCRANCHRIVRCSPVPYTALSAAMTSGAPTRVRLAERNQHSRRGRP